MTKLALAVLVCLVTVSSGCANKEGNVGREKHVSVSWDSPVMRGVVELASEWKMPGTPIILQSMVQYDASLAHLADLLNNLLVKERLRELAKSCATMPFDHPRKWHGGRHDWLVQAIVLAACDRGDRETVVAVLSAHFVTGSHIEYSLAQAGKNTKWDLLLEAGLEELVPKRIEDGITMLFDAYSEAKVPKVRRAIAETVRNAFVHSGVRGEDDASFVANARQWYEKHKGELELNSAYRWAIKIKEPLFKVVGPSPRTP